MTPTNKPAETRQLRLTTLSPLAISTGEKLSPYSDFVEDNNRLYLIDTRRVEAALADKPALLDDYVAGVTAGMDSNRSNFNLKTFLTNRLKLTINDVSRRNYPLGNRAAGGVQQQLYTIMKTPLGLPYVPGSSLKGAIKTALLYDWLTKQPAGKQWLTDFLRDMGDKWKRQQAERQLKTQFDRYQFQVTDSEPFAGDVVSVFGTARLHLGKADDGQIPQRWETITKNQQTRLSLTFHQPPDTERLTWAGVATCLSNFSYNANSHELNMLPDNADYNDVADFLVRQQERMNNDPAGVYLRLGSAKGYFHNSVGLAVYDADPSADKRQFREFLKQQRFPNVKNPDPERFPATRPLVAGTGEPLGWVKLETF